jgi:hypothetical protein
MHGKRNIRYYVRCGIPVFWRLATIGLCFQIQEMLCLSLFCIQNIIKLICRCFRRAMSALTDTLLGIPQCHLYMASVLCVPCQLKVSQYSRCHIPNACQLKVALSFVFFCILMSPLRGSLTSMTALSPICDIFLRFSVFCCHLYCHLYLTHFPYVSFT